MQIFMKIFIIGSKIKSKGEALAFLSDLFLSHSVPSCSYVFTTQLIIALSRISAQNNDKAYHRLRFQICSSCHSDFIPLRTLWCLRYKNIFAGLFLDLYLMLSPWEMEQVTDRPTRELILGNSINYFFKELKCSFLPAIDYYASLKREFDIC
ncbi:UNVERIFIED_CONTAM: hypothetical protein RMT77_001994 [Armadillidium vulgare]